MPSLFFWYTLPAPPHWLAAYRDGREVERHPLELAGSSPFTARVSFAAAPAPEELVLLSSDAAGRPVERGRWRVRRPTFEADADAVARPDRGVVGDAFDVMPHPVAVDDATTGSLGDAEHAAVDMRGHADEHMRWRCTEARRPRLPNQRQVAADAARGDDGRAGAEGEIADDVAARGLAACDRRLGKDRARNASHRSTLDRQRIGPVPEAEADAAGRHQRHPHITGQITIQRLRQPQQHPGQLARPPIQRGLDELPTLAKRLVHGCTLLHWIPYENLWNH